MNHKLLEQRRRIKAKKPHFLRQDAHRNKSLAKKWIKPKGMHAKMRIHLRGRRKSPSPGYSSPRAVKGMNRQGLKEVVVRNANDLKHFDHKTQVVVIGHVGTKRKVELMKICEEKKYTIANVKDVHGFIHKVETKLVEKKKVLKEREDKKKKSKEESLKKAEEKKEEPKEETNKEEKSEKVKILEKRQ
jgi:large subunit ribosomal protein L32e